MPQPTLFSFLKTVPPKKVEERNAEDVSKKKSSPKSSPVKKNQELPEEAKEDCEQEESRSPEKPESSKPYIDIPGFGGTALRKPKRKMSPETAEDSEQPNGKVSPIGNSDDMSEKAVAANGEVQSSSSSKSPVKRNVESSSSPISKKRKISESSETVATVATTEKKSVESSKANISETKPKSKKGKKSDAGKTLAVQVSPERNERNQIQSDSDSPIKRKKSKTSRVISSDSEESETEIKNEEEETEHIDVSEVKTEDQLKSETVKTEEVASKNNSEASDVSKVQNEKPSKPIHSFFAPKKGGKDGSTESSKTVKDSKSSGSVYDPTKSKYHPVDDACWKKGERVPYFALARTLREIENISGRLRMTEILANFFRSVIALSPNDLLHCVYLCLNRLAPEYVGLELGVGETVLMKALAQATGRTVAQIKAEVAVEGDLGLVAESSRGNQRVMFSFPKLTVFSVFSKFKEIAEMTGNASMSKKIDKIQALFSACRDCEARYIIRSLSGKLRIGLAEQSVLAALAQAAVLTPPEQPEELNSAKNMSADAFKEKLAQQTLILKSTYCECSNYELVIPVLLKEGISGLPKHCQLMPGMPLKPMLAHPTKGIQEILKRFDSSDPKAKIEFTCEFKYDGERAQIHNDGKKVKIFSRNQEDNTTKFPDVISRLNGSLKPETKSFILDSEIVAWDREAQQILPFQVLSTRKRKDAADSEIKVQVCVVAFDLLYLNGESLVKKTLKERRELLRTSFMEVPGEFMFAQSTDGNSAEIIQEFLDESVKGHCEGLMVKSLEVDASYEIAKRSHNWLKLKKDYLQGVGDTLDLVVIGAWYGKGKRTGLYGGFLLACYDKEIGEYQTICKLGTGFKDHELKSHTEFFQDHVISSPKSLYQYSNNLEPDVWFKPFQVWEVKCADLSISPVHKAAAGIVDPGKGISLRFPRFLRIRDRSEKKPEDATTSTEVAKMYWNQQQIQNQAAAAQDEEDFY